MEKRNDFKPDRKFWFAVFFLYLFILSIFILFKHPKKEVHSAIHSSFNKTVVEKGYQAANFIPFHSIKLYLSERMPKRKALINLGGNFLGFIPLGFILPMLSGRINTLLKITLSIFFISLGFELIQLITNTGVFDVDDLMLNTLGGFAGAVIFQLYIRRYR